MSRRLARLALAAVGALALAAPAVASDEAYTTRIEPRPFYGATVTIESGVRVFRPLPTTRQVIVNPGGQTPLNLGYYDTRIREESTSTNYNYNYGSSGGSGGGIYPGLSYGNKHRGHHHRRGAVRSMHGH